MNRPDLPADTLQKNNLFFRQLLFLGILITIGLVILKQLGFFVGAFLGASTLYVVLRPLLFRRQVLSKYLSPPDFQVAGQGLSLFSVAHSQPGPPSGVRRQIALPSKFFFSPGFLWTAPGETGIIIYGKYAFVKHCQGKRPSMRSSPARPLLALPEKSSPGICSHFPAFLRFLSKFVL